MTLKRSVGGVVVVMSETGADDVGEWERARHDELDGVMFGGCVGSAAMRYL